MSSKIRLLTRMFDLSVEGESPKEVEELMDKLEERGYIRRRPALSGPADSPPGPIVESTTDASKIADEREALQELPAAATSGLIGQSGASPVAGPMTAESTTAVTRVVKRDKDIYILAPKFPGGPGGDRVGDAAMILLAAYGSNDEAPVTGSRLLKSLRNTGYSLERVDKILEPLGPLVLKFGARRGTKYKLSEAGRAQAVKLAEELLAIIGQPTQSTVSP
jgi:hypothetical protein